jgi:hypothetical protein
MIMTSGERRMTIEYDNYGEREEISVQITRLKAFEQAGTSQTEPSSHPTQNIPDHPPLIQLIIVQYLESRINDGVSKYRAFSSLGKYLRRIRCRRSPYREEEQKEEFAQGGVK